MKYEKDKKENPTPDEITDADFDEVTGPDFEETVDADFEEAKDLKTKKIFPYIIWITVIISVVAYFGNNYLENKAKREAEQAEAEKTEQTTKAAVLQMVSRTNAVDDWASILSKDKTRQDRILTVELERLWLQQPILFIGSIKDISTYNQSQYVLLLEMDFFSSIQYMFSSELQLSLVSDKKKIDLFLEKHPDSLNRWGNAVAVVARINSIKPSYVSGEEGELIEVKTGEGELIDILYTGKVHF